jgi:hypothetical protein
MDCSRVPVDFHYVNAPRRRPGGTIARGAPGPPHAADRLLAVHRGEHGAVHVVVRLGRDDRHAGPLVGRAGTGPAIGVRPARGEGVLGHRLAVQHVHHGQRGGVKGGRAEELGQQVDLVVGEPDALRHHGIGNRPAGIAGAALGQPAPALGCQVIRNAPGQPQ